MITNIRRNRMGTTSFDGKFDGMRKAHDFTVYPMYSGQMSCLIQSSTRIGKINLQTGLVMVSPARAGGSYSVHLAYARDAGTLSGEELLMLKAEIFGSASGHAGTNGIVYTDNSGAIEVFQQEA